MNKVEEIINEVEKIARFKGTIKFYMMDMYGFILGKDVEKLKELSNVELEYNEGTLQNVSALRYKAFDPNNHQPFNSILKEGGKPISINVQPEYFIENEFVTM